ncbi:MAG: glycosyltransferase family 39 protein [Leptospiraceae bacterium]|nr:glycosyltransferase family 39 protein [Leptospiraceae bacterium]
MPKENKPNFNLFVLFLVFGINILLIQPWGDFPLNDDWQYAHITKQFAETLQIKIDVPIAPTVILQTLFGGIITSLFGFSHTYLRILTLFFSSILILILYSIQRIAGVNKISRFLTALVLITNPLFIYLSLSYMTEIYGMTLSFFGVWLWFKARQKEFTTSDSRVQYLLAAFLMGLSFWVRQFSILVYPSLFISVFIVGVFSEGIKLATQNLLRWTSSTFVFAAPIIVYFVWAITTNNLNEAFSDPLKSLLVFDIYLWLQEGFILLFYLTGFFAPILVFIWISQNLKWKTLTETEKIFTHLLLISLLTTMIYSLWIGKMPYFIINTLQSIFPFLTNIITPYGLGPLTLTEIYTESLALGPSYSIYFWVLIECGLFLLAWVWGFIGSRTYQFLQKNTDRVTSRIQREILTFGIILTLISFIGSIQSYQLKIFDRYYFPCFIGMVLTMSVVVNFLPLPKNNFAANIGFAVVWIFISSLTVAAEHDYFVWNEVRQKLVDTAIHKDISEKEIDGGYEVNGWFKFEGKNKSENNCVDYKTWYCAVQKKYTIGLTLKPNQEEIVSEKVNTWLQNFPDMKLIKR